MEDSDRLVARNTKINLEKFAQRFADRSTEGTRELGTSIRGGNDCKRVF